MLVFQALLDDLNITKQSFSAGITKLNLVTSLKIDDISVDPLPFIEAFYCKDTELLDKIKRDKEKLQELEKTRTALSEGVVRKKSER